MGKIFGIFTDKGEFSWRKIMTAGCLFLFMLAVIGYLLKHEFDELPQAYLSIIAGVFGFYFLKSFLQNIKIGSSNNEEKK
jgi:hypothetical protein